MLNKLAYYIRKSTHIGLSNVLKISYLRVRSTYTRSYWRSYALHNKKNNYRNFSNIKPKNLAYVTSLYDTEIDRQQCIEHADAYVRNEFSFLGSTVQYYERIPWHTDFRLQQQDVNADVIFDNASFYQDIRITQGEHNALTKDIKVPWELSRFHYLYVLGKAYEYTKDQRYADAFQRYVTDWLDNNIYLRGINWLCPMEVGIRAINWIVGWEFFKSIFVSSDFRECFISSLYDHMIYLENNWEFYDSRTNNHYLSNLVAYLYLCWFFADLPGINKKRTWVVEELMRECEKQVFTEGTSYEGSTSYHCLVTELFYHAYLLFQEMNIPVPSDFRTKLSRMFDFIRWCTINNTALISVGDNDSGKVLHYGLTQHMVAHMQTSTLIDSSAAYFPQCGLSVVKTYVWHVTLRHHAYNALQPTGHFHNDIGSITLAIDGIPVIIDPGSFVYTPSVAWRNYFRSVAAHNTSFIDTREPVPLMNELFALRVPERLVHESPRVSDDTILLHMQHALYKHLGLHFTRQLEVMHTQIQINDQWTSNNEQEHRCHWNFTLAPNIAVHTQDRGLLLSHEGKSLITLQSPDLTFAVHDAWVSYKYGEKEKTYCIRAARPLDNKQVVIELLRA